MKVFLIAAISADGFIGQDSSHTADWTSKADKKLFVDLTKQAGVMVMGSNTFKTIGHALPGRKTFVYTTKPEQLSGIEDVEATDLSPADLIKKLQDDGFESIAICGGAQIYGLFLKEKLITDIYLTVEPVLFGSGVPLSLGADLTKLELVETKNLNQDSVLLHYTVGK